MPKRLGQAPFGGGGRGVARAARCRHACKRGLEGIMPTRKGSPYRSGRSPDWRKMKIVFRIGRSRTGLGLFATAPIKKGAFIVEYKGRKLTSEQADRLEARGNR
jgi:hypothetical protein